MTPETMWQSRYAAHRGVTPARISTLIKQGKIPTETYTLENGHRLINVAMADHALSQNLFQNNNPRQDVSEAIAAQRAASKFASIPTDGMVSIEPGPAWDLRYIVGLIQAAPSMVEVTEKRPGSHWVLKILGIDEEDHTPAPWTVELKFGNE